jgi:predicted secreted protein
VEIVLSEAQNGAQLAIYMGDTLVVRLSEIAGSDYRWMLTPLDATCLEMTEHRYEPARAGTGAAASVWWFEPKRAGRARLELTRRRAWTAAEPPAERFTVDLELR